LQHIRTGPFRGIERRMSARLGIAVTMYALRSVSNSFRSNEYISRTVQRHELMVGFLSATGYRENGSRLRQRGRRFKAFRRARRHQPSAVSSHRGFRTSACGVRGNATHRGGIRNPSQKKIFSEWCARPRKRNSPRDARRKERPALSQPRGLGDRLAPPAFGGRGVRARLSPSRDKVWSHLSETFEIDGC